MPNSLLSFPEELRIKILAHLDAVALARCSMTCKLINDTIRSSSLLACTIHLYFSGLKDTGTSAPHIDLLDHLLRYRQAWISLDCVEPITIQMPHGDSRAYELVGDTFAYTNRQRMVEIISLPTSNNMQKHTSQSARTRTFVRTFAMDPTQDMIALLHDDEAVSSQANTRIYRIHIRTISTDTPHPLVYNGFSTIIVYSNLPYGKDIRNPLLHIAHNILALTFYDALKNRHILIWDWTTTDLILNSSVAFDPLLPPLSSSVALDPSIPLLSSGYEFCLLDATYCFVTCPVDSGSIRLYKFRRSSGVTTPAIHLATLHLPPISLGTNIVKISAQSGPVMAHTNTHIPFAANEEDRLHVFTMVYWRPVMSLNLFVHQRVFMNLISQHASVAEGLPLEIPWEKWGPQNTRIIFPSYAQTDSPWRRYVHGQRAILHPRAVRERSTSVEFLDFSLAAVLAAQGTLTYPLSSSSNPVGVLIPPSTIRLPIFQNDVETRLPYVSSMRELRKQYYKLMINEENIIGVNTRNGTLSLDMYMIHPLAAG